ncbi:hypothetical protein B0H14DRAFT_2620341 [Mycena olivaceomarginata]|nr:hypothetical protein B0H14DRAFT_2620341 [Mycena olivaceomarginata]
MSKSPAHTPSKSEDGLTRAQDLWFQDCGLIIQAENTIFRVSGAILAVQSTVFRDMLSLPTRGRGHDGWVSLRVASRHRGGHGFFDPFPASTTFPILSSVLRMSHKYEADALRKRALVHLSHAAHPTTLEAWDALPELPWSSGLSLDIVPIARQLGAEWILPTSFYRICQSSFDHEIVTGTELSDADKVTCIKGLRYLETTGAAHVLDFLLAPYSNCSTRASCVESRQAIRRQVETERRKYDAERFTAMPLELVLEDPPNVCSDCFSKMKKVHEDAQEELWDDLPRIFGLDDWEKLEAMKAEALK